MLHRYSFAIAFLAASGFASLLYAQQPCENLMGLALTHTTITSAVLTPAGSFTGPSLPGGPAPTANLPARCVVKAIARPTRDSEIKFEVWLPAAGWNGKYQQVGNGGWAGAVPLPSFFDPLQRGYAVAGTDDGHDTPEAAWAIGHPEKLVDFGYRAVHETSVQAKAIVRAFYGREPSRSYFVGCSDGGREALMEAQRYAEGGRAGE